MELERSGFTDESGFSQRKGDVIEDYDSSQSGGDWTQTSKFSQPERIRNKKSHTLEKDLNTAKGKISKLQAELKDAKDAKDASVATTAGTDSDKLEKTKEELKTVKAELVKAKNDIASLNKKLTELTGISESEEKYKQLTKNFKEQGLKLIEENENLRNTVNKLENQLQSFINESIGGPPGTSPPPPKRPASSPTENPTEKVEKKDSISPTQKYKRALLTSNTKHIENAENIGQALNFYFDRNNLDEEKLKGYLTNARKEIGDNLLPEEDQLIVPKDNNFTLVELVTLLLFSDIFDNNKFDMADLVVNFQTFDENKRKEIYENMEDTSTRDVAISWAKTVFKVKFEPHLVIKNMLDEFDKYNKEKFTFGIGKGKYRNIDEFINVYATRVRNIYKKFSELEKKNTVELAKKNENIVTWSKNNMISKTDLGDKATENVYERKFFKLASNVLSFPGFGNSMDVGEEEEEEKEEEIDDDDDAPLNVNALAWF
jgi:predicted  nucleic acid-binding Zn-ribbon protein